MANNPTVEDIAREIRAELYAVKSALAQAHDKLTAAFGAGYEILGADVSYNDPYNACTIMEIPLLLDHVNLSTQEVTVQIFNPEDEDNLRVTNTAVTAFVASCAPSCGTPYPKDPSEAGCCDPDMAWKRGRRGYYCCTSIGCDLPKA